MMKPGNAAGAAQIFFNTYMERRDEQDPAFNCIYIEKALRDELDEVRGLCRMEYSDAEERCITEKSSLVLITAFVDRGNGKCINLRITAVCEENTEGGFCITSFHACFPASLQRVGEFFPVTTPEMREQAQQARQYDHLFQSVLCGIVQYRFCDSGVVFLRANNEAIRLFGYTKETFWNKKDWKLEDLVAEEDRERIFKVSMGLRRLGDTSSFEYRIQRRNGTSCWIIGSAEVLKDDDGNEIVQSVYLDIDARKKAELSNQRLTEQVEVSNEILHLALEHTATCEYYYYPRTRECVVPKRTCEIYQCREHYDNMPDTFIQEQVAETFHPVFIDMFDRIQRGERTASCEFCGIKENFWCRETLTTVKWNESKEPTLVIGIVEDITRQKEMEAVLEASKSRDPLTGLYNKENGVRLVQKCLGSRLPGEHCVMMMLDMDNFKQINHKEGSLFADTILQEVADVLRAETKPEDIRLRLGGDEFMLLIRNSDKKKAVITGPRIAEQVKSILAGTGKDIQASVSIGMCSTEVAEEYNALYRCAESTLKYVKENGKGRAACYLDTSNELGVYLTQLYSEAHPVNVIEAEGSRPDDDLVSFALELLGKSKNLDDAVFLLLSRVGKIYHFDRVSILEASREYLSWHFTYQWASDRSRIQLGQNFYVSTEDFDNCGKMYDEEGLADYNLRDGISDIASCLHAGIWNYGEYVGSMSFEINQENYQWTPEHRKLLKELVKLVPSFIMKSKADAVSRAKTDFLSRMSHEIRTPMNAISGMTSIAKSVLGNSEKMLDCLEKIESANTYLLSLINDILDMSRIESGKMEINCTPVNLSELLASLESLFGAQTREKGLSLKIEDGRAENRLLLADGLRLNQIFVNIIGNAVKFTDHGGITVRVEELESEPRAALRFSVSDSGIGIEAAALSRIFNAFEQVSADTAARYGGTGLGLSISNSLVQMMGGTLEVRSEVGEGSEFYFVLSLEYAQEEAACDSKTEERVFLPDFEGCQLLLAEDNELNQEIARSLLEMNGFTVTCAANGKEALELFCAGEPERFDAILMDIRMPVMDGLEATRRIRTSGRPDARTIPVLALSANAFDEDTKKSIESGMDGHLSKPIQVEKVLESLSRCINKKT